MLSWSVTASCLSWCAVQKHWSCSIQAWNERCFCAISPYCSAGLDSTLTVLMWGQCPRVATPLPLPLGWHVWTSITSILLGILLHNMSYVRQADHAASCMLNLTQAEGICWLGMTHMLYTDAWGWARLWSTIVVVWLTDLLTHWQKWMNKQGKSD